MSFIASLLERAQVFDSLSVVSNCSRSAFSCAYGDGRVLPWIKHYGTKELTLDCFLGITILAGLRSRQAFLHFTEAHSLTSNTWVSPTCGPSRGLRLLAARAVHYSAALCAILRDGMETVGMLGGGKGGRYRPHRRTESSTHCHLRFSISSVLTQNRNRAAGAVV